jgi:hypothetical protein
LSNVAVGRVAVRSARAALTLQKTPRQVIREPGQLLTHRLVVTSGRAEARGLRVCDRTVAGLRVASAPGGTLRCGRRMLDDRERGHG